MRKVVVVVIDDGFSKVVEVEDVVGGWRSLVTAQITNRRSPRLFGVLECRELAWTVTDKVNRDLALEPRQSSGSLSVRVIALNASI